MTPELKTRKPRLLVSRTSKVLREIAQEVPLEDVKTPRIRRVLTDMRKALDTEEDGVAIAAPQIGQSLRIFLVSDKALQERNEEDKEKPRQLIFINPVITKLSKKKKNLEEGCLSVRYLYGQVERSEKATVRAYDENGKRFEQGASGLMAQIFQHEIDHLNGVLFIDKAENIKEILPPTSSRLRKTSQHD